MADTGDASLAAAAEAELFRLARRGVLDLSPYIPGKPIEEVRRELGLADVVKMASNESPLGPSPRAVAAIAEALSSIHIYPEGPATVLREALAVKYGLEPAMVLLSNGGDNVITLICLSLLNEGEEAVIGHPTFSAYEHAVMVAGGRPVLVPLREHTHDLEAMLAAIGPRTKLVFICNPNNPTGTFSTRPALQAFLEALPEGVVTVIDEAYGEYADNPTYPQGVDYVKQGRKVVVLRTFSKIYGLAGLRVGYAMAPAGLISLMDRVREPFPVNRLAQIGALAALADDEHLQRSLEVNRRGKGFLYRELAARGLGYLPTEANFILIDLGRDAGRVYQAMLREGVIVRPGGIWGLPTWIRLTIGREEDNRRFLQALDKVMSTV